MAELLQYKCPCCGGGIEFDSQSQNMKCPYCDTEFDTETLKAYDEDTKTVGADEIEWNTSDEAEWNEDGVYVYSCQNCGGEIMADATTAATECPYCNNPVVISKRLSGELRPNVVIPFKLD